MYSIVNTKPTTTTTPDNRKVATLHSRSSSSVVVVSHHDEGRNPHTVFYTVAVQYSLPFSLEEPFALPSSSHISKKFSLHHTHTHSLAMIYLIDVSGELRVPGMVRVRLLKTKLVVLCRHR